jgi:gamma-glutamyltranspeptidase/glutathione hydrolase
MLVYIAKEKKVHVVDFGPISPHRLDPADFPLTGGFTTDLFTWPTVKDDRNVHGPNSIAVPGHVDGLATALAKFGSKSFADVIAPAIELADQGMAMDWYLTLKVATMAKELARYPSTRDVWLPGGYPPVTPAGNPLGRLKLKGLADTLRKLQRNGPRDYYEGEVAASIVKDIAALGGIIDAHDLKNYHARIVAPLEIDYRGARIALAGGLTAGPSIAQVLKSLQNRQLPAGGPGSAAFVAYAQALREAYAERLATMGETDDSKNPGCTTHFNVVDREGNMVAHTQTLLSVFGSRVVLPTSGVLMNNGMMWFDPRPESPNYFAPAKRPLTNMCPLIARRGEHGWFSIGASGGPQDHAGRHADLVVPDRPRHDAGRRVPPAAHRCERRRDRWAWIRASRRRCSKRSPRSSPSISRSSSSTRPTLRARAPCCATRRPASIRASRT